MRTLLVLTVLLFFTYAQAEVRLPKHFCDHMVLQREASIPIIGWADGGENVSLTFQSKVYRTKANRKGRWRIVLPELKAGGPYEMIVSGTNNSIQIKNIMIGDVWLCSGQSNMEWTVQNSNHAEEEIQNAGDPNIRHFKVPRSHHNLPQDELIGGDWKVCSPDHVGQFTAVGYYFAKELRKNQDVAIGLLNSSWGGSRLEAWMRAETLGFPNARTAATALKRKQELEKAERQEAMKKIVGEDIPTKDLGIIDGQPHWALAGHNDVDWQTMELPNLWERMGLMGLNGMVWFRKIIYLSDAEAKAGLTLGLAKIDDSDDVWVNGRLVGGLKQAYNTVRQYEIRPEVLHAGENIVAVRVEDTGGDGGIYGEPELLFWESMGKRQPLAGPWKYKVSKVITESEFRPQHMSTILYNQMIHPILGLPIKGVIWYQGESNTGAADAYKYRELFANMIVDWREQWGVGEFPFLFVQLANFMEPNADPGPSNWAMLRESQSKTLAVPNTGQAVIIDIGEAKDIHPRNKQDVGKRLALAARKLAYKESDVVYSGPQYRSMSVENDRIRLQFDHLGSGLMAKDRYGYLKSFTIAGADQKFVWAKASIEGDEIIVWSPEVKNPVAVRYAWANNPEDANLYNKEGLPASPFRTDDW